MAACNDCHPAVVQRFLGHGMARSVGPVDGLTPGVVTNPLSKVRYEVSAEPSGPLLTATFADGGQRRQRIVGRIGAGIFDTSWVGAELDGAGAMTPRLFFAPVETLTGRGLVLSPFETHAGSAGLDLALTGQCLTCHTLDPLGAPFPGNHLGADAFDHLSALTCAACHGDVERHAKVFEAAAKPPADFAIRRLGSLSAGAQRDVCARCHLQGEARVELVSATGPSDTPLAGRIPVLVPARALEDDFRFVGQLERLALSACFKATPSMTCTTCHQPHFGVKAQGVESFDAACAGCHPVKPAHTTLKVADVAGGPPRSRAGCVDCHVRRSAPFDLPHVRSADHFIRRRIAPPRKDVQHRQFADEKGEIKLFDDGRLAAALATPAGERWRAGTVGMGYLSMLRLPEAAVQFEKFPPPGTPAAREASAPAGLTPLETSASFHLARGLVLMTRGAVDAALAAFSDAVALDAQSPDARLARARLALARGDIRGALFDTQAVIVRYPHAEQPWDLRVEIARRAGRPDLVLAALQESTRRWPSNARAWLEISALLQERGDAQRAREALERARTLSPGLAAAGPARTAPRDR
jgi:hypothetical protein